VAHRSNEFSTPEVPTMPKLHTPITADAISGALKDAGYITVGLAVLAAQKLNVQRQELRKAVHAHPTEGKAQLAAIVEAVEGALARVNTGLMTAEAIVDTAVERLEDRLPEPAGSTLSHAHETVKVAREQVRNLLALPT
jgi:hypothetical protein